MHDLRAFLEQLDGWLATQPAILAALLVGSQARGTARPDSDIDLVLIARSPAAYLQNHAWLQTFGPVIRAEIEDWGLLQSVRVLYEHGPEVEFGITTPQWAEINPVDAGTQEVVRDGARILFDPQGILAALLQAVQAED